MSSSIPYTEQDNPLTDCIDEASATGIVKILNECNEEIFQEIPGCDGIFSDRILSTIVDIADVAASILKHPRDDAAIVLSGCGTSGRYAFLTARSANAKLMQNGLPPRYEYIIAGGDRALFTSGELFEDDLTYGIQELQKVTAGKSKVLYVGITCGLSAPFVAGQLDYCLENLDVFTPVLLGFNPINMARKNVIEKWNKSFHQVANNLQKITQNKKGFVLNPVVGPEPITGSSRMKCGSATKILLEIISIAAYRTVANLSPIPPSKLLKACHVVCRSISGYTERLGEIVLQAGECLKHADGRIFYIGAGATGIIAMIDASECTPTFGSSLDDIRGFLVGGYPALGNKDGDLGHLGQHFRVSVQDFETDILPTISKNDLVIYFVTGSELFNIDNILRKTPWYAVVTDSPSICDKTTQLNVQIPTNEVSHILHPTSINEISNLFLEIVIKWIGNAISTGAHILKGKVFHNSMFDVKVRNNKLFFRAVGIIKKFAKCSDETAASSLLKAIYRKDELVNEVTSKSIEQHVEVATPQNEVVPLALILALGGVTVMEATAVLQRHGGVKVAVQNALAKRRS